jgi:AcrR family transcriptional regulator
MNIIFIYIKGAIMPLGAKPAVQGRSRRSRDAIVEALDGLLREKEFAAIGVAEIAARAEVSAASIYQRFSNKDAAVSILLELYLRRVDDWSRSPHGGGAEAFNAPDLRAALMAVGVSAWRQVEALGHVMRPAYLYSRLRPDLLGGQWSKRLEQARAGFRALLEAHRSEIRRTDLDRAAGAIAGFTNMMLVGLLLHRDDIESGPSGHELSRTPEAFAGELADFALGYLAVADRPRRK